MAKAGSAPAGETAAEGDIEWAIGPSPEGLEPTAPLPGPAVWATAGSGSPAGGPGRGSLRPAAPRPRPGSRRLYWNETWSAGAPAGRPSTDSAVRCPIPLMMITIEFPLTQSLRFTISWRIDLMSWVRWLAPASPTVFQVAGVQVTDAAVRARLETSNLALPNAGALPDAWPWIVSTVESACASSAWNWIEAPVMVAFFGIATFTKRSPTNWLLVSNTSSRSVLLL